MNVRGLLGKLSPSHVAGALGNLASVFPLPTGRPEPVLVLDVCKLAVTVAAGYGWIVLPTPEQAEVASGAAAAVWLILSWLTRDQVTPKNAPQADGGIPLTPAAVPDTSGGKHEDTRP